MAIFIPLLYVSKSYAGLDGIWFAFNILLATRGLTLWLKKGEVEREAQS